MTIAERIAEACGRSHQRGNGVMPPQVCPFCFGCPIATIVVGVSGANYQTGALPIPKDKEEGIIDWLDKLEAKV